MPILGTKEQFPHTWIAPVQDLTVITPPQKRGYIMGAGYIPYGNPLTPVELTEANTRTFKEKSVRVVDGGNVANETIYHINQYFSKYSGGIVFTRLVGADSTNKVVRVVDNAGTLEIDHTETLLVYGSIGSITEYRDTLGIEILEFTLVGCPVEDVKVSVSCEDDMINLVVQDKLGNEIFDITGSSDKLSEDDYGMTNYIGNMISQDIAIVKASNTATGYVSDWDAIVATVPTSMVDAGLIDTANVRGRLDISAQIADYAGSFGLGDVDVIDEIWGAVKGAGYKPFVIDLKGATYTQAKAFRDSLSLSTDDPEIKAKAWVFWNEGTGVFLNRRQNIGISGWYLGKLVSRNQNGLDRGIESRVPYTITGLDHKLPIVSPDGYTVMSKAFKNEITKDRINYVEIVEGEAYVSDFLTSNHKETYLKQIGIVDGLTYIEQWIAHKLEARKGRNIDLAIEEVASEMDKEIKSFGTLNYFQEGTSFEYTLESYNNEGILAHFEYYPTGHVRINKVRGTIKRNLN